MEHFKQLCRDMSENPHIMTFSDIAHAAASGVAVGQKAKVDPVTSAVLGVSLEAGRRAVRMTEELIEELARENKDPKPKPRAKNKK